MAYDIIVGHVIYIDSDYWPVRTSGSEQLVICLNSRVIANARVSNVSGNKLAGGYSPRVRIDFGSTLNHHTQWLTFLRKINRETSKGKAIHLIADNYAPHKHSAVQAWLNKVERFFRVITTDRLGRGVFRKLPELGSAIR